MVILRLLVVNFRPEVLNRITLLTKPIKITGLYPVYLGLSSKINQISIFINLAIFEYGGKFFCIVAA